MRKRQKTRLAILAASALTVCLIAGLFLYNNVGNDNPLEGVKLYADPGGNAASQVNSWHDSRPEAAAEMTKLASLPTAKWLTSVESLDKLDDYLRQAAVAKASPLLVAYNIPLRDCGLYSAGGVDSAESYRQFIDRLSGQIKASRDFTAAKTIVIVEPDALPALKTSHNGKACLTEEQRKQRYELVSYAVTKLKSIPKTIVYIDAGNSTWVKDSGDIARRLQSGGIGLADGFSLNVSNFHTTEESYDYGLKISDKAGGKHFVIDTSRNGNGPFNNPKYAAYNWCNPPGRALGHFPTTNTGLDRVDAFLYVKVPGESDGQDPDPQKCFGGPPAGQWDAEYALGLIKRWPKELQP